MSSEETHLMNFIIILIYKYQNKEQVVGPDFKFISLSTEIIILEVITL